MKLQTIVATMDPLQNLSGALPEQGKGDLLGGNLLVLVFAALVVVTFVAGWAMFIRKPSQTIGITPEEAASSLNKSGRRRKMKHRYPSRAETGGLPPMKS